MNYTEEQISVAFNKLPRGIQDVVFTPEIDKKVQKIGIEVDFPIDKLVTLYNLVNFAIMNLVPRDTFTSVLEKELSLTNEVTNKLTEGISREIFASIEAMGGRGSDTLSEGTPTIVEAKGEMERVSDPLSQTPLEPAKVWEKAPDVAPDNLPIAEEGESLLPQITPTLGRGETAGTATHPFEEKMKKVFTAGQQSMGELTIEPTATQETTAPDAPRIYHADPYRETIE